MKKFYLLLITILIHSNFNIELIAQENQPGQKLNVTKLDNPYPGYLLFDLPQKASFTGIDNYGYFLDLSEENIGLQYIYQLKNGNFGIFDSQRFYIYNSSMQAIDTIPNPTNYAADFHDFISLSNGHYLMLLIEYKEMDMSQLVVGGKTNAVIFNNRLIEVDGNGTIYWSWNSLDHLNILDATNDIDLTQSTIDYAHINALFEDDNGNILVSIRHFDEISLIDKVTGNFIWRMGGTYCKNNQFNFINDAYGSFSGFSHQHSPSILPNGNILLFDNGNLRSGSFSRVVEYSMNYANKTATRVWEYRNSPDLFCAAMGSVNRLPNGNTLINWSLRRITEVKPDNSIAFEITDLNYHPIYRIMKVGLGMAYAANTISNSGEYSFSGINGNTGVKVNVSSISNSTQTYVQKHNYPPHSGTYNENEARNLLPYRWVFTPDKSGINITGEIKINLSLLENIGDPKKLVIYKRDKEGTGNFQLLTTTYSSSNNELKANFSGWGEFVVSVMSLSAPSLIIPENSTYLDFNQEFSWSSIIGATSYKIELSKDSTFKSNKFSDSLMVTKYKFTNLDYNTKYFWRVKAKNSVVESEWSNIRNFTTTLAKPLPITPEKNKFGISNKDTLIWGKIDGADRYHLQISIDSNFFSFLINDNNLKFNQYIPNVLSYNTKYYWRVKALNNNNSGLWSEIFYFTSVLAPPDLSLPYNLSVNNKTNQIFTWNKVDGASNYIFQIAKDEYFTKEIQIIHGLKVPKSEINNLNFGATYFWRVKSARTSDTSEWSSTFNFSTLISQVNLQLPKNNSNNVYVNTQLYWEEKELGIIFKLQLGTDSTFVTNEIEKDEIQSNYYQIDELKPNTKYWWRVMAYQGDKISDWSQTWNFVSNDGYNFQAPLLYLPKDNSETTSEVNIQWKKIVNAKKYEIQLALNKEFDKIIYDINDLEDTKLTIKDLDEEQFYFWRVKALSKYDSSDWSIIRKFKVVKFKKLVQLVFPINDDLQIPLSGNLEWNAIDDADNYTIQLADNAEFINPILVKENYNQVKLAYSSLKPNTIYYWRVRYSNSESLSEWSEVWNFKTKSTIFLDSPTILSHQNGNKGVSIIGKLEWNEITHASQYQISISTSRNFSTIFFKKSDINETEFSYPLLDYSTTYYIRISASNETAQSSWSTPIEITTELESPKIDKSLNGQTNIPIVGRINWLANSNDHWYRILISKNDSFEDLVIDYSNFENNYYNYSLDYNTIYYCKVKTYNDTNFSDWSETISFTTEKLTSVDDNNLLLNIKIYPNPAQDYIIIENLDNLDNFNLQDISIFDLLGNEFFHQDIFKDKRIEISHLPKGMYFIRLGKLNKIFIKL